MTVCDERLRFCETMDERLSSVNYNYMFMPIYEFHSELVILVQCCVIFQLKQTNFKLIFPKLMVLMMSEIGVRQQKCNLHFSIFFSFVICCSW